MVGLLLMTCPPPMIPHTLFPPLAPLPRMWQTGCFKETVSINTCRWRPWLMNWKIIEFRDVLWRICLLMAGHIITSETPQEEEEDKVEWSFSDLPTREYNQASFYRFVKQVSIRLPLGLLLSDDKLHNACSDNCDHIWNPMILMPNIRLLQQWQQRFLQHPIIVWRPQCHQHAWRSAKIKDIFMDIITNGAFYIGRVHFLVF